MAHLTFEISSILCTRSMIKELSDVNLEEEMNLGHLRLECYRYFYLKFLLCKIITCKHLPIAPIKKYSFILKQAIEIFRRML